MSNQENDPFASPAPGSVPSFNAGFETDVTEVGKLAGAMDNLARSTDKADGSLGRLSARGKQVQSSIHGILASAGLSTGTASSGNKNGGNPSVSAGSGNGRGNGGLTSGGLGPIATADYGLDLARYVSRAKIPGYGNMQNQLAAGVSLDAYATQWAGAYGRAPSQIPSMLRRGNGGAIGTPDQVAAAAQYGASMGAIPGVTQQGNTYWSSINQLQRMSPGMGSQQAAQVSGNLLNPQSNTTIAQRYGIGAAPIGKGGITKTFNQAAADILKALKMSTRAPGQMPTKEQLLAGLLPGSRMRQQMRVGMGLDDDTITMIINWGINNSTYQSRGGQGNYDPSDINQRKLATGSGSRDSLSNYVQTYQQSQTNRTTNFMQGQYGSLQDMTQMQTSLTDAMSKVDDAFTGLYAIVGPVGPLVGGLLGLVGHIGGAMIALRAFSGSLLGAAGSSGASGVGTGVAGTIASGGGTGVAIGVGAAATTAVGGGTLASGLSGYIVGKRASSNPEGAKHINDISNIWHPERWDVGVLNPLNWGDLPIGDPSGTAGLSGDFKKGLGRMMAANPNITVTSGYRSGSQQGAMNRAGVGRVGAASDSWHVRGMAADLGPPSQFGWIAKNAQRFGLDSGARLGEPWHVQKGGTAGKRPPSNLAINQSARGAGQAYRPFKGAVGDLPGLTINDILTSRQASINASGLFSSRSTAAGTAPGGTAAGTATTVGSGQVDKVIAFLYAQIGKPYSASQPDGPDSWDCSGLVTGAYKTVGIILPSLTFSQVKMGTEVPIDPSGVRPGDALFMRGGSPVTDLGHVAVAVSSSEMISAPHTGSVVHKSSIPWGSIQAIRRYINAGSTAKAVGTSGTWDDFLNAHMETSGKLDPSATLSGPQIAADFYNAGFRGSALTDMVAISGRESGWNPTAFNFHAKSTGDVSLGLTQINVKGSMISRLKDYGLSDPRQLLDPNNAAHASFVLSSGGTNLSPWGGYKGLSDTYGTNMTSAQQAVDTARTQGMIGDLPVGGGSGGAMATGSSATPSSYAAMSLVGGRSGGGSVINITNHFHVQTTGDTQGGMRVAQVAGQKLVEQFSARTT